MSGDGGSHEAALPPHIIEGRSHSDERGTVSFVNSVDLGRVDRFYTIRPSRAGVPRGWVGHRRDWKWFFAAAGEFRIAVVTPDDWQAPSHHLEVRWFALVADRPSVLEVPPGNATLIVQQQSDSVLLVLSSGTIEEAAADDYRFPPDTW